MHVGVWAAAALVLTLALAGCSDDGNDGGATSTTSSSSASTTGTSTPTSTSSASSTSASSSSSTTTAANKPPTAHLTASTLSGAPPLGVNFTVEGSDLDGGALTWVLAFGDGNVTQGTELPANVSHAYGLGNHTANLTVSDGSLSAFSAVLITVTGAAGPVPLHFEEAAATGSTPVADGLGVAQCVGFTVGMSGIDCSFFELPPEAAGRTFVLGGDTTMVEFLDVCSATEGASLGIMESGTVPAGAGCVAGWYFGLAGPEGVTIIIDIP